MSQNTKLIVVKLDDESSPLMKQYTVPESETKPIKPIAPLPDFYSKKKSDVKGPPVAFDELSFAMERPKKTTNMIPITTFVQEKPKANFSILAASKEVDMKKKVTLNETPKTHILPPIKEEHKYVPSPPPQKNTIEVKPKPKLKPLKPFKNIAEDGYKIGFMPNPTIVPKDTIANRIMPKKPKSLPKLEAILGIKATVVGNKG